MCGITAFFDGSGRHGPDALRDVTTRMTDAVRHRGPDDHGVWVDPQAGIALGHRRLSIIDLSAEGHQPMVSHSGRYVIVYNGEVYNFQDLRKELDEARPGIPWRGHSDTEVVLAAIETWGLGPAVGKFNGMFAFALWDREERTLSLARDRFGKKPLYYGRQGSSFVLASELKAIKAAGLAALDINRGALSLLLRVNYVPAPYSIYDGIYKLPAACILSLNMDALSGREEIGVHPAGTTPCVNAPYRYWDVRQMLEQGAAAPAWTEERDAMDALEALMLDAVSIRMIADVPLGAFLSGGVDSSIVVALMQAQSSRPVKTFSIGYHEAGNEAHFAKAVAEHLGTDHTELYLTPDAVLALIPRLPVLSDEPHGDTALIPTFLVSQLARNDVTVCLAGDGGDELFSGYPRYLWAHDRWGRRSQLLRQTPAWFKKSVARALRAVPVGAWNSIHAGLRPVMPARQREGDMGEKIHDLARMMAVTSAEEAYHDQVYHWKRPETAVLGAAEPPTVITDKASWSQARDPIQRMVYLDIVSRLPDSIVSKVDRASMQVSLEARCPILDYRVAEFSFSVPTSMKISNGMGKRLLRQLLHKYVPRELVERPKMGFKMPVSVWIRGPLRDWAESLLDAARLQREGFFEAGVIRRKWEEHVSGEREWHYHLWDVLMFQAWLENDRS